MRCSRNVQQSKEVGTRNLQKRREEKRTTTTTWGEWSDEDDDHLKANMEEWIRNLNSIEVQYRCIVQQYCEILIHWNCFTPTKHSICFNIFHFTTFIILNSLSPTHIASTNKWSPTFRDSRFYKSKKFHSLEHIN